MTKHHDPKKWPVADRDPQPLWFRMLNWLVVATLLSLLIATLAAFVTKLEAKASPQPCAYYNTCQYLPSTPGNGPLMPTWDTPGTYGGWTTNPVQCNPVTYECKQVVS